MENEAKTSEQVLAEYIAARRAAGTASETAKYWRYHRGWYRIGAWRYRRKQLEEMTANLLVRTPTRAEAGMGEKEAE